MELHLVDELGGLDAALDYTARQIGAQNRDHVAVVELPRPRTPFDRVFELLDIEVAMGRVSAAVMTILEDRIERARIPSVSAYDPFLEQGL